MVFDFLTDDASEEEAPAPALVAAAPAPVPPARGRGGRGGGRGRRGRGRGRGQIDAELRQRMILGRARQLKRAADDRVNSLSNAAMLTLATATSDIMGPTPTINMGKSRRILVGGECIAAPSSSHDDPRGNALSDRAAVSHCCSQASGLAAFLAPAAQGAMWSTNIFDDANLWIRTEDKQREGAPAPGIEQKLLGVKLRKEKTYPCLC